MSIPTQTAYKMSDTLKVQCQDLSRKLEGLDPGRLAVHFFNTRTDTKYLDDTVAFVFLTGTPNMLAEGKGKWLQKPASTVVYEVFTEQKRESFFLLCEICYSRISKQDSIDVQELSTVFLQSGFERLREDHLELIVRRAEQTKNTIGDGYCLLHPLLEAYFSAVHLNRSPVMSIIDFVTEVLPVAEEGWTVLKILSGLCGGNLWNSHGKSMLPQILNCVFTTQLPVNEPVILLPQFLHILECLKESNDAKLYRMLLQEYLTPRTIVISLTDLRVFKSSVAAFIVNSLPSSEHWTCFVHGGKKIVFIRDFCKENEGFVVARDALELNISLPSNLLVLTTRKENYLRYTLTPLVSKVLYQAAHDVSRARTLATPSMPLLSETSHATASSQHTSPQSFGPYGYITEAQYESKKKLRNTSHFNLVKDLVVPHIQMHSTQTVQAQYRKSDHLWMSLSRSMRHEWYETVRTTPNVPVHWVKVQQPDGFEELEKKFKSKAQLETRQSGTAELVILNSQYMNLVEIVTPSSNVPVTISLQAQYDEHDQGVIGCDFLQKENEVENVCWFDSRPFDIKRDQRIGRLLPLPSKKVELGASTTLASIAEGGESFPQGQSQFPSTPRNKRREALPISTSISSLGSYFPSQTKPYLEATADVETIMVTEHQIKKEAMNGFDQPGYCFYGDQILFQISKMYPLPDSLSTCHMLREGGNGVVLEVKFSGEVYAVKKTAFRWREVLIMPKLRHKNILKLVAMMIGQPLEGHPRRRYVYQFYPRMSNDLGRSVGSFEKHCLRTLGERYMGEPLLLKKIKSNFCYVAHEILVALEYLHSRPRPIIHRDVKASNILIKMVCDCPNPLICVCRKNPAIVLSDFDASLELHKDGTLEPDPPRASSFGFQVALSKVYHVSAVGTVGYKSPEGSIYCIGNHLDIMPALSTKADIFSFGLLMSLLFLNEEGPRSQEQMAKLLLFVNQTTLPQQNLSMAQRSKLEKNGIKHFRPMEIAVSKKDVERVLPLARAKRDLNDNPEIISFLEQSLHPNPSQRSTASSLLQHPYLREAHSRALSSFH